MTTPQDTRNFKDLRYIAAPEIAKNLGGPLPREANMTPEEVLALAACENYAQFRATCDALKLRRGYDYPPDWYQKMVASGVHAALMKRFDAKQGTFTEHTRKITDPLFFNGDSK